MDVSKVAIYFITITSIILCIIAIVVFLVRACGTLSESFTDKGMRADNIVSYMSGAQATPTYKDFLKNVPDTDAVEYTDALKLHSSGQLSKSTIRDRM
jgi:hypothetical protein